MEKRCLDCDADDILDCVDRCPECGSQRVQRHDDAGVSVSEEMAEYATPPLFFAD